MSLAVLTHVLGDQALHHQQGLMRNSDSPVKWGEPRERKDCKEMVGPPGLEPGTNRLWGWGRWFLPLL